MPVLPIDAKPLDYNTIPEFEGRIVEIEQEIDVRIDLWVEKNRRWLERYQKLPAKRRLTAYLKPVDNPRTPMLSC